MYCLKLVLLGGEDCCLAYLSQGHSLPFQTKETELMRYEDSLLLLLLFTGLGKTFNIAAVCAMPIIRSYTSLNIQIFDYLYGLNNNVFICTYKPTGSV